jgi:hypothetical protein
MKRTSTPSCSYVRRARRSRESKVYDALVGATARVDEDE